MDTGTDRPLAGPQLAAREPQSPSAGAGPGPGAVVVPDLGGGTGRKGPRRTPLRPDGGETGDKVSGARAGREASSARRRRRADGGRGRPGGLGIGGAAGRADPAPRLLPRKERLVLASDHRPAPAGRGRQPDHGRPRGGTRREAGGDRRRRLPVGADHGPAYGGRR